MSYQPPLILTYNNALLPISNINASVIWLHGLGADGHDFEPIVEELALPGIRFILPHAPVMPVTLNSGYAMPAWYDLYGLTAESREDDVGIQTSQNYINTLIQKEIDQGILPERIVLAGFSQGGAMALHAGLRYPQSLAAILALSTYVPLKNSLAEAIHPMNQAIPIFMAHGIYDEVISLATSKHSRDLLQERQIPVTWHEYAMAHSVCTQEISDIRAFLQQVLVE
jgi:phospholipase/carboxylesterase